MTEFQKINACAKRPIDIWTNYIYYTLSLRLVYGIRKSRISPNQITLFSLFLALVGCVFFAMGSRHDVLWGLLLVQVSYVFDCADGQLARYRKQYSPIGGWLDQVADRIKEFAVYFSLAFGYTRFHPGNVRVFEWGMVALFALYLLEYYGQIEIKPFTKKSTLASSATASATPGGASPASGDVQSNPVQTDESRPDQFERMQRWRSLIPFRGFIIGEQYFTMLVFILFGAIYPFFVFVSVLGLCMCVYRPAVQIYKLWRAAR